MRAEHGRDVYFVPARQDRQRRESEVDPNAARGRLHDALRRAMIASFERRMAMISAVIHEVFSLNAVRSA